MNFLRWMFGSKQDSFLGTKSKLFPDIELERMVQEKDEAARSRQLEVERQRLESERDIRANVTKLLIQRTATPSFVKMVTETLVDYYRAHGEHREIVYNPEDVSWRVQIFPPSRGSYRDDTALVVGLVVYEEVLKFYVQSCYSSYSSSETDLEEWKFETNTRGISQKDLVDILRQISCP